MRAETPCAKSEEWHPSTKNDRPDDDGGAQSEAHRRYGSIDALLERLSFLQYSVYPIANLAAQYTHRSYYIMPYICQCICAARTMRCSARGPCLLPLFVFKRHITFRVILCRR